MADWDFGINPQGWIPPLERTAAQLRVDRVFLEVTPLFHQVNRGVDLPASALLYDIEKKATGGKLMPRIHQRSGSCLPRHAPVRMADGTEKEIQHIAIGDMVVTHTGVARQVLGIQKKRTVENMHKIRVRGWADRLFCTSWHLLPVWCGEGDSPDKYHIEWTKAEDVKVGDYLLSGYGTTVGSDQTIDVLDWIHGLDFSEINQYRHQVNDVSKTHRRTSAVVDRAKQSGLLNKSMVIVKHSRYKNALPRLIPVTPLFARWIGLYLAEGCVDKSRVTFTISRTEETLAQEIIQLTKAVFGLEAIIHNSKIRTTLTHVRIGSATLAAFVKAFAPGVAATKRVPGLFFSSLESVQRALIGGWFDGDGYAKMHHHGMRITGVSGSLGMIRDFAQLAMSCEIPSSTHYRQPRGISKESAGLAMRPSSARLLPSHKLSVVPKDYPAVRCHQMTRFGIARKVMTNEQLDVPEDDVFDIEVDRDHSFLAWGFVVHNCVGSAAARCYGQSICGDVVLRGDAEDVKMPFPFATYGIGRKLGGMNRPGEGSFGSAQAKAIKEWGMLPIDDPRVPQPEDNDGWLSWGSATEIKWSHPSSWPVNERELAGDAAKYQIESVAGCNSTLEVQQSLAQGYGVTMASSFGTNPKVVDGFLVGDWNTSWAHQMSLSGFHTHPSLGLLFVIDNQWGANAHPACPFLSPLGVRGSFWIKEKTLAKIIDSDAEIFSHSNTKGFPVRLFDWGTLGI